MQIHRTKPDSAKRSEKCMKFDSAARFLNQVVKVLFYDTESDSAIRSYIKLYLKVTFNVFLIFVSTNGSLKEQLTTRISKYSMDCQI